MTGAVWDREFFRRRAEDDNTALLFEDQPWSWRELLGEAATRSAAMVKVRPEGRPWHIGVLLENTPEYVFLIAGAALCGATVVGINPTRRGAGLAAYNAMPIFHGNALMSALGPCIANGAAFALRRRFSASGFRPDIRRFGATLVERILVRFPGVTAAAVYPVPDPVTGDQVMAAQAPRLLWVTARLPKTATHKISKPSLRRLLWHGEKPVYERLGSGYSLMTADRKDALEAEFARHGRDQFLRL